jgi:formylglycine-generating enzyme required for sulfatase activity
MKYTVMKNVLSNSICIVILMITTSCCANELNDGKNKYSLWNRTESVKDYAKKENLELTKTLNLGEGINIEFVLIPAGRFIMGSPHDEEDRKDYEGPQHVVTISKPFYMSKYEITQEAYELIMGYNNSTNKGKRNPIDMVTREDAKDFCEKLGEKTGRTIFLPSEAEWEYACRAGSETPLPPPPDREPPRPLTDEQRRRALYLISQLSSEDYEIRDKSTKEIIALGEAVETLLKDVRVSSDEAMSRIMLVKKSIKPKVELSKIAWFRDNSGLRSHPVGELEPNDFGLYDMLGNVDEWVEDTWHDSYDRDAPDNGCPWITKHKSKFRVVRGGAFLDEPKYIRSATRYYRNYEYEYMNVGLRIIMLLKNI